MPGGVIAPVAAREVDHQHRQIDPVAHHRGEGLRHPFLVAPDEGVVVERVGKRYKRPKRVGKPCKIGRRNLRPVEVPGGRQIGRQPGLAAGAAHRGDPVAGKPSEKMEKLQCLEHVLRRVGLDDPAARKKGRGGRRIACQRRRVRACRRLRGGRLAGFDGDNGFAARRRLVRHRGEVGRIGDALDIEPGGAHPVVGKKASRHVGEACLRLVADAGHVGDRQAARLHADIDRDVRRLADDGDAAFDLTAAMLVRPQHRAVEIIQNAIAVRPQKRHRPGRRDKRRLQVRIARLGESRRETDRAAAPHRREGCRRFDGGVPVDAEERRVGRRRQVVKAAETGDAGHRLALRMDRPDVAVEPRLHALRDDVVGPPAAENDDRTGPEQSRQVGHH